MCACHSNHYNLTPCGLHSGQSFIPPHTLVNAENTKVAHLVLGPCSVLSCADEQVNVAALIRLVQMLPDGEHSSGSFAPTFHPVRGEHPIDHLDVALQLHCSQKDELRLLERLLTGSIAA